MSAVLLPTHVVSHLYGEVVRQPPGPAAAGDVAEQQGPVSHLQGQVLHSRRLLRRVRSV